MPFVSRPDLSFLCLTFGLALSPTQALESPEQANGVNLSLDEGFGARHQAMATRFAGFQIGADAVGNAPAGLADIDDLTFSSSHSEQFAQAKMDHFAAVFPFDAASTLGLALARYGVSDIEFRPEGSEATALPPSVFSTADYWVTAAMARRWGPLDLGASLQILYRDLDQAGLGMRGDVMATYTLEKRHRLHALLVGALPSSARWSSGYSEYEPTDLKIGASTLMNAPYFYGHLQLAWESEGLFQASPKSNSRLDGRRGFYHPLEALKSSNLGAEFLFDFGLALRLGLEELRLAKAMGSLWHIGLGYTWKSMVGIDYSFNPHPDLPNSHRLALQFTPVFPKFTGKGFRPKASSARMEEQDSRETMPSPETKPETLESKPEPEGEKQVPSSPDAPGLAPVSPEPAQEILEE